MKIIRRSDAIRNDWSGGSTWTFLIEPETSELSKRNFNFRISSASVETEESLFSDFSGYQRYLTVLTDPISLVINGRPKDVTAERIVSFQGSDQVRSFGKTLDLNVFTKELECSVDFETGLICGPCYAFSNDQLYLLTENDRLTVEKAIVIRKKP